MNLPNAREIIISADSDRNDVGQKVEKKGGKRFGYNYIVIKSLKESQKNDVVKCLYIKSLTRFGFCVIKEGTNGDTKDKEGRDITDRLKWQQQLHQELQGKIRLPRYLSHFEENGNYYLVIEYIKGKSLQNIAFKYRKDIRVSLNQGGKVGFRFLSYLVQISSLLEILHAQQVVHRDATPNNYMILPNGKVALIDMEMCYSLKTKFPTPAFQLGTYGYMSPQQQATMTPTAAEDIFALGAIILQLWSNIAPAKIIIEPAENITRSVSFFVQDQMIADVIIRCLSPNDDARPTATEIKHELISYKQSLLQKKARPINTALSFSRKEILDTLQQVISTLCTPLYADHDKGWFADDMKPGRPPEDKHKLRKKMYASYNRGVTGIIYMLGKAKQAGLDVDGTMPYVQQGLDLVKQKYTDRPGTAKEGFHFGSDGIAAVLASVMHDQLIEPTAEYLDWINLMLEKNSSGSNMTNGVSGQGIANLICKSFVNPSELEKRLLRYADLLIARQELPGYWTAGYYIQKYTHRKLKRFVCGFGEGISGIIYFLLEYGYRYQHRTSVEAAAKGLRWLMNRAKYIDGTIQWYSCKGKQLDLGLMDGVAGIALTFIRAYELTGNQSYKLCATKTLLNIPVEITDTNIGQANGLSGLGEVYLEAYRVFREQEWLERAGWVAQVIMQLRKQHPKYGMYWLVEQERQPVANFMVGTSGVMHFLLRYCHPEKITLPLLSLQQSAESN